MPVRKICRTDPNGAGLAARVHGVVLVQHAGRKDGGRDGRQRNGEWSAAGAVGGHHQLRGRLAAQRRRDPQVDLLRAGVEQRRRHSIEA
jgi:hypothetical protein